MSGSTEEKLNQFLREFPKAFTARGLSRFLSTTGIKITVPECENFLDTSPYVLPLKRKIYITRAGAFCGKKFSFKPTNREIEQGVFIVGHRGMPFIDNEVFSGSIRFLYKGDFLPGAVTVFDSNDALDFYFLYGQEFSAQYIASDPANEGINICDSDLNLPPTVKLTGIDFSRILHDTDFKYGDRLVCTVTDWKSNILTVEPLLKYKTDMQIAESDMNRQHWYARFEEALLEEFRTAGPCASMEEQLAYVFYEHGDELCGEDSGSVEEYLKQAKRVGIETFGLESRLWYKDNDVPAVGTWNERKRRKLHVLLKETDSDFQCFIINCYIKDFLYEKKTDLNELKNCLIPGAASLSQADNDMILDRLEERKKIIEEEYNWFADYKSGEIRHEALDLYKKETDIIYDIDDTGRNLQDFPQQPLVIVSQIMNQVVKILESLEEDPAWVIDAYDEVMFSLDGMSATFDDIKDDIASIIKEKRKDFTVI